MRKSIDKLEQRRCVWNLKNTLKLEIMVLIVVLVLIVAGVIAGFVAMRKKDN